MIDSARIIRAVLEDLGLRELARVKSRIGSQTLREAIRLIINESEQRADLFIPHYWAIWYHDGHGRVYPRQARKLVFFDNPQNDPRLSGGRSPERASQVRRLTRDQYQEGLRRNQERAAQGRRPFMFVVDSTGPAAPHPFFRDLEKGAAQRADQIVLDTFERELLAQLDADPDTKSETKKAQFKLG